MRSLRICQNKLQLHLENVVNMLVGIQQFTYIIKYRLKLLQLLSMCMIEIWALLPHVEFYS